MTDEKAVVCRVRGRVPGRLGGASVRSRRSRSNGTPKEAGTARRHAACRAGGGNWIRPGDSRCLADPKIEAVSLESPLIRIRPSRGVWTSGRACQRLWRRCAAADRQGAAACRQPDSSRSLRRVPRVCSQTRVRRLHEGGIDLAGLPRPTSRRFRTFLKAALTVLERIPQKPFEINLRDLQQISIELLLQFPKK